MNPAPHTLSFACAKVQHFFGTCKLFIALFDNLLFDHCFFGVRSSQYAQTKVEAAREKDMRGYNPRETTKTHRQTTLLPVCMAGLLCQLLCGVKRGRGLRMGSLRVADPSVVYPLSIGSASGITYK